MPVFRRDVQPVHNFSHVMQDHGIPLAAKGLYAYLNTLPDNFLFDLVSLAAGTPDSVGALETAYNDLIMSEFISVTDHEHGLHNEVRLV